MSSLPEKPSLECGNCSFKDRWLLHHVRLQGEHRRLCTSCVLKLNRSSFCPICYEVFEGSVPNHERLICLKCRSITHTHCLSNSENVAKPYTCPPCSDPKFAFFDVKRNSDDRFEIDVKSARVLLCAAKISAESMRRAVLVVEADAQRRVKEAAASRKRAKEALEEMAAMVAREKVRKVREDSSGVAGSANGFDRNGVGISGRDNVAAGISAVVPPISSSHIGLQNRTSTVSNVLGSNGRDNVVAASGNCVPARPMNVDNVDNAGGKHGSSSPCRPAEDKK